MSSTNDNNIDTVVLNELVEKIHSFFSYEIDHNNDLTEAAKESLTVAIECIEQAYKVQKKSPSKELFNIYKTNRGTSNNESSTTTTPNFGATLVQNLANTILSQATAGASARSSAAGSADSTNTGTNPTDSSPLMFAQELLGAVTSNFTSATSNNTNTQNATNSASAPAPPPQQSTPQNPPKIRKKATEAEKMAAESFKNQGNDAMKQDSYQEALDYYSQAISIDDNNAIYYSNRAAAKSKMGDHQGAISDCQEAIEIDPTYSKAYGRMGLAWASLEDHRRAREGYMKAVELDPSNESYRNNLMIAEEKLNESANTNPTGGGGQNDMMSMLRSMMSDPQVVQMAMRSLQDPRMLNLFSNLGGNLGGGGGGGGNPPPTHQ